MTSLSPRLFKALLIASIAGLLIACGGGGGGSTTAGISDTGITSGPITAFGSIYVNGVRFDIDSADITVDDDGGKLQSNLRKGMQVVVRGDYTGTDGSAVSVEYDELVQGPIAGPFDEVDGTKTFTVFGIPVTVDSTSTVFETVTFDALTIGNVIEISGLVDGSGNIIASYIEKKTSTTEGEIKGTVSNLAGDGFSDGSTFNIGALEVTIKSGTVFEDLVGNRVRAGDYVEVEGTITGTNTLDATEIEREDETYGDDGDEVNIKGIISNFNSVSDFKVGNQSVDASGAVLEPATLVPENDLEVEVEGYLSGGVLIADEVESEDGEIELSATVSAKDASSIYLSLAFQSLRVFVEGSTQMEDESSTPIADLDLDNLPIGSFVKLNAYKNGANIIAKELKRDDIDDVKLQGPVDSKGANSLTILGITFTEDATSVSYKDENEFDMSKTDFYNAISTGTIVEVVDKNLADGDWDEGELE